LKGIRAQDPCSVFLAVAAASPVRAQDLPGDWGGERNSGFKVRSHIEQAGSGFQGKVINPGGNETVLVLSSVKISSRRA
jgi:hypothetical protein